MTLFQFNSVRRSVVSNSLQPHEPQHARPSCPSPTPRVYSNSSPLNRWCPPTISSFVIPFSPCLNLPQHQGLFKWVTSPIRWPKYWRFSFNISPSNEHSGVIFFRMVWLDLPAVQETRKRLLKHHRSKASILRHSAFFTVQLSCPYMTTGKTIALTRWNLLAK